MVKIYDNIDYFLLKVFDCINVEMDCVLCVGLGYVLGVCFCFFLWVYMYEGGIFLCCFGLLWILDVFVWNVIWCMLCVCDFVGVGRWELVWDMIIWGILLDEEVCIFVL